MISSPKSVWVEFGFACAMVSAIVLAGVGSSRAAAQEASITGIPFAASSTRPYHTNRMIIRVAPSLGTSASATNQFFVKTDGSRSAQALLDALRRDLGAKNLSPLFGNLPAPRTTASANASATSSARDTIFLVELDPDQGLDDALSQARRHPNVVSAQPDFIYTPDLTPNDPSFPQQYAHRLTEATSAWDLETGDPAVTVAVIGFGIDRTHPDLIANMWTNVDEIPENEVDDDGNGFIDDLYGWDFKRNDAHPEPNGNFHETHVAGVVAAVGNNSLGVSGVAWNVRIMALRVAFESSSVAQALAYAQNNGARVINMSFGNYEVARYGTDTVVAEEIESAFAAGIVLVATAGNNAIKRPRYPAALPEVIAVAATDSRDRRAAFSNWGSFVSVAAPGVDILSTVLFGQYGTANGTSFAAPYVSGLAALLLSKEPGLTPTEVRRRIEYSSDKIETDRLVGAGRVNAFRALSLDADPQLFALIKSPLDGQVLVDLEIVGTALGDAYQLHYRAAGSDDWIPLTSGAEVVDGALGSLEGISLSKGFYELRLMAAFGGASDSHEVTFFVADILSGWPQGNEAAVTAAPVYADVDGDGDLEVFVTDLLGGVHGWHHDGTALPNWPVYGNVNSFGSPTIGDIDGDGEPEILQATLSGRVYAFHLDGTKVRGWRQLLGSGVRGAVVLADFDKDGAYEVVVAEASGRIHVWKGGGTEIFGWPAFTAPNVQTTPAIGDLDGDGFLEVVVKQVSAVYAWHRDGRLVAGWPVVVGNSETSPILLDTNGDGRDEVLVLGDRLRILDGNGNVLVAAADIGVSGGSMGVGDVDGDGIPEICFGLTKIALLDLDLNMLPGWPKSEGNLRHCMMADVDGDRLQEVVAVTQDGRIFAWNGDGSLVSDQWPLYLGAPILEAPALGDLDGDGMLDLMVGSAAGELTVFKLGVPVRPGSLGWPMFQGGALHDGHKVFEPVPEPSAGAQGLTALLMLAALQRRRGSRSLLAS